jgi:3-ketosteroid 9alpha-monooxygenase subunit B
MTDPAPRKRIKEMEVMVADVVVETPDTATLVLFTGNDRLDYKAGHFLTIDPHQFPSLERFIHYFEDQKGKKEPPRAYSMASAPHEKYLAITIKEERYVSGQTKYPPLLSPLLVKRTLKGMRLVITGFTGPYVLEDDIESKTDHLVHVCAGSGVVPNFAILKHALTFMPKLKHTFVYSNKTWDDIIFRRELDELRSQHPERVKLFHALTREEPPVGRADVRKGRVSAAMLKEAIPDPGSCIVYTCGPAIGPHDRAAAKAKGTTPTPRFLESVLEGLAETGVPKDRIEYESYG